MQVKREENMENSNKSQNYENYLKAVTFAVEKHKAQKRKAVSWPYAVHLYEVSQILQENLADNDTVLAGILHDTVEDTNTTLEELAQNFGYYVASIVDVLSENKSLPYAERKALQAQRIKTASREAKMVKCADCLSNLRSLCLDLKRSDDVWSKFNSTKENIQAHYSATIEAISELEGLEMYKQLKTYYNEVFSSKTSEKNCSNEEIRISTYECDNFKDINKKIKIVSCGCENFKGLNKTTRKKPLVIAGAKVSDCTECQYMARRITPDPNDWFNDDDMEYSCTKLNRVLSEMNRPYEKQPIPDDCPFNEK